MLFNTVNNLYFASSFSEVIFPYGLAIDVTYKCNLRCKHCYFHQQNYKKELSVEEWLEKIKKIKDAIPGITSVDWIGGEPLLRPELIEKGMKYFPINIVITNGTIALPKWKKCTFLVSIDGTKEYHKKNRTKNIYDKIKKNINRDDVEVYTVFTINKENAACIDDFLKEWSTTKIKGVLFLFYTPIKGIRKNLWMGWKKRDEIIIKLINLKKKYKHFITNNLPDLEAMKHKNAKKILKQCLFRQGLSVAFGPDGKVKKHCNMGEKADCSRCGCIVPYYLPYLGKRKIKLSSNYHKILS